MNDDYVLMLKDLSLVAKCLRFVEELENCGSTGDADEAVQNFLCGLIENDNEDAVKALADKVDRIIAASKL